MKKILTLALALVLCFSMLTAWGPAASAEVEQKNSFSMYSCYVEAEVAAMVEAFTKETGIKVNYVRLSAGEMQARIAAERENPQVAMIFGMGNDLAMAMDDEGLLDPFTPANIDEIYEDYIDPKGVYIPLHTFVTCFGTNKDWLEEHNMEAPTSWEELLDPVYQNEIMIAHPATSGASYNCLSAIVQRLGVDEGFEYLKALDKNVINYTKAGAAPFTSAGLGECAVAIGHSDNAYQAYDQGYPIVITFPKEGAGYGVGCAAMVKGGPADEQEAAHKFIEWLVGVQAMKIANEYDMYPLNKNSVTDDKMVPFEEIVRVKIDTRLSAETKAENCARFEAEVRSTADIIK